MKILNTPIDPESQTKLFEVVCQHCSADIEFSREEAVSEITNVTATILTVICPVCNLPVIKIINNKIEERLVVDSKFTHLPF